MYTTIYKYVKHSLLFDLAPAKRLENVTLACGIRQSLSPSSTFSFFLFSSFFLIHSFPPKIPKSSLTLSLHSSILLEPSSTPPRSQPMINCERFCFNNFCLFIFLIFMIFHFCWLWLLALDLREFCFFSLEFFASSICGSLLPSVSFGS